MVRTILFGKLEILLFLVCSTDLDIVCSRSSFHNVKFYSVMFMRRISSRVICVNGISSPSYSDSLALSLDYKHSDRMSVGDSLSSYTNSRRQPKEIKTINNNTIKL